MIEELLREYGATIEYKTESKLMKALGVLLWPINKHFDRYITTIGKKIYVPSREWMSQPEEAIRGVIYHECVHLDQQRSMGRFAFAACYLDRWLFASFMSSIFVLHIEEFSFVEGVLTSLGIAVGSALCYGAASLEAEAYARSIVAADLSPSDEPAAVEFVYEEQFASSRYGWMGLPWHRQIVLSLIEDGIRKARAGSLSCDVIYKKELR